MSRRGARNECGTSASFRRLAKDVLIMTRFCSVFSSAHITGRLASARAIHTPGSVACKGLSSKHCQGARHNHSSNCSSYDGNDRSSDSAAKSYLHPPRPHRYFPKSTVGAQDLRLVGDADDDLDPVRIAFEDRGSWWPIDQWPSKGAESNSYRVQAEFVGP